MYRKYYRLQEPKLIISHKYSPQNISYIMKFIMKKNKIYQ